MHLSTVLSTELPGSDSKKEASCFHLLELGEHVTLTDESEYFLIAKL